MEVGAYPSVSEGIQHSLAILAVGRSCWLVPGESGERLLVEPADAELARTQLAWLDRESAGWPPRAPELEAAAPPQAGLLSPLVWAIVVLAAYSAQGYAPGWREAGALDAQALFGRGEWWRPLTALFLHGDVAHVVANTLCGIFVFRAVIVTFGRPLWTWFWLALAAVAANLAAAAIHYGSSYRSVGASTAVFAGLGLLTGRAVRRSGLPHRGRAVAKPLAAGLTLLGLFGAGGMQTDVVAHLTGFTAGMVLGFSVGRGE